MKILSLSVQSASAHGVAGVWGLRFGVTEIMSMVLFIFIREIVAVAHMVVSQKKGTPIQTLIYYNPYYEDPKKGTPNFGNPPYDGCPKGEVRVLEWRDGVSTGPNGGT